MGRIGDWCQTYTGKQFWPLDPRAKEVDILDIAHALALQNRFAGHCRVPYSVAEHSVRVAALVEQQGHDVTMQLAALLHDASEAYLVDLPRPLKRSGALGGSYSLVEDLLARVIEQWAELPEGTTHHAAIKHADNVLLATEARDLMAPPPVPWVAMPEPLGEVIVPWSWEEAERRFLVRAVSLLASHSMLADAERRAR